MRANVGATNRIAVRWHSKSSLQPSMNLLASVTNQTLVTIEDGLLHTDTWLDYEILRGSMEECRLVVPADHRILDVTASSRIQNWQAKEEEGNQIVEITFLAPLESGVTVEVHTERQLDDGVFQIGGWTGEGEAHGIHALDVVRESGQIAIRNSRDVNITIAEQVGVVRTEAANVGEHLQGQNDFVYRFYSPELRLSLSVSPVEPRLIVSHDIQLTFQNGELQAVNTVNYSVDRAGIFELKFNVPDGLTIDDVECRQMQEFDFDSQSSELTILLRERTEGSIAVTIRSHQPLDENNSELTLPLIEPLQTERETGTIWVYSKEAVEVITVPDGLAGAQPHPAPQRQIGDVFLNSAWTFTRRPVTIPVRTERKPTRLSVRVATTIDVQPELTQVQTRLDYLVEYAGVDTFRFEVPEERSANLRIEVLVGDQGSAPIKQRTADEPADGWVTWTIQTQREVLGRQRFLISDDISASNADEVDDSDSTDEETEDALTLQLLRPLGTVNDEGDDATTLTNVEGEVLIKKERSLSIAAEKAAGELEMIDLRELRFLPQDGTLAYRYFNADAEEQPALTIRKTRYEIQDVVSTVVSRGLIEIVAGEEADATYRCTFHLKTTERQRLLVHLPVNLEVLGTYVNDREIKLEKADLPESDSAGENWTPFWVNVARPASSDQSFLLTFQFLWRVNPPLGTSSFARGRMLLPLPILGDGQSSVAQELKVAVWVPEKYLLVGDTDDFQLETERSRAGILPAEIASHRTSQLSNWVRDEKSIATGGSQFPTEGRTPYVYTNLGGARVIELTWWNRVTMTIFVSIAIAVIGWILMRTSWENKLGMLLIAVFIATLYGLSDQHALFAGLMAARFGLWVLIGLWVIHGLFTLIHAIQPPVATASSASPNVTATHSGPASPETTDDSTGKSNPPGS